MGTRRSFEPFPNTLTRCSAMSTSRTVTDIHSDTLSPAPYASSSIARSLNANGSSRDGADRSFSASSGVRTSGSVRHRFGASSRSLGSRTSSPSPSMNRKYVRTADTLRLIDEGERPRSFRWYTYSLSVRALALAGVDAPFVRQKVANLATSLRYASLVRGEDPFSMLRWSSKRSRRNAREMSLATGLALTKSGGFPLVSQVKKKSDENNQG